MTIDVIALAHRPQFIDTVAHWYETAWPQRFSSGEAHQFATDHARVDGLPFSLIATVDGEPAGMVSLRATWEEHEGGPWVGGLYVRPESRGQGLASLLSTCAARLAWDLGYEDVYVATAKPNLFEQLGWEEVQSIRLADGRWIVMRAVKPEAPPSLYEQLGGQETVRRLVNRFYDLMDERSEAAEIRAMHARSLRASRDKLFRFMSGWLGGPNLYIEEYGHPRLRMRHMSFAIGTAARDQWMDCMEAALDEVVQDERVRADLKGSLAHLADHMRNREGD